MGKYFFKTTFAMDDEMQPMMDEMAMEEKPMEEMMMED